MLIFRLQGGLGNQMFQYAFGRYLSVKNNKDLFLDTSFYESSNSYRELGLNYFNVKYQNFNNKKNIKVFQNALINKFFNYLTFNFSIYSESKVSIYQKRLSRKKKGYFDGYWQSYKYFSSIRDVLINDFSLVNFSNDILELNSKISNCISVGVHIRKSDYLTSANSKIYAVCSKDYYIKSILYILKFYPEAVFFIFTDDKNWVIENIDFSGINYEYISMKPHEDLYLMSKCKHNIISNSTFSWWSAWLNNYTDKIVVSPKNWFVPESNITHDIIPNEWIRINN
jgi:hypothetical protein